MTSIHTTGNVNKSNSSNGNPTSVINFDKTTSDKPKSASVIPTQRVNHTKSIQLHEQQRKYYNGADDTLEQSMNNSCRPIINDVTNNMNGSIKLNGGNEITIDEKNISLHLNNPFMVNNEDFDRIEQPSATLDNRKQNATKTVNLLNGSGNQHNGYMANYETHQQSSSPLISTTMPSRTLRPHSIVVNTTTTPSATSPLPSSDFSNYNKPHNTYGLLNETNGTSSMHPAAHNFAYYNYNIMNYTAQNYSLMNPTTVHGGSTAQHSLGGGSVVQQYLPVIPRRSQSTPRPLPTAALSQPQQLDLNKRPRSLDRSGQQQSPSIGDRNYRPPVPSRRPKSGATGAGTISPLAGSTQTISRSGMRQSVTFHGQLNNLSLADSGNDAIDRPRKTERPVSYAYGTLPDQSYIENQLKVYSEQLRNITETVRKYSEQAKLLSELKRKHQVNVPMRPAGVTPTGTIKRNEPKTSLSCDSLSTAAIKLGNKQLSGNDSATVASQQLRYFLDDIRSSMKELTQDTNDPIGPVPNPSITTHQLKQKQKLQLNDVSQPAYRNELQTPSDQLRHFLDAIRKDKVIEDDTSNERFYRSNDSLPKSNSAMTSLNTKPCTSSDLKQPLKQPSDDLDGLTKAINNLYNSTNNLNKQQTYDEDRMNNTEMSNKHLKAKSILDFNQILDNFHQLKENSNSVETVDYLKKCSEALRESSEQLKVAIKNTNYYDSPENNSSCSTTPGSIREAVQNLLMQPRNGFQILDDRLRLFIDILDSQEKFSQVSHPNTVLFNIPLFFHFYSVVKRVGVAVATCS